MRRAASWRGEGRRGRDGQGMAAGCSTVPCFFVVETITELRAGMHMRRKYTIKVSGHA